MRLFVATPLTGHGNVHELNRLGSIELGRRFPDAIITSRQSSNIAENREELSLAFLRSTCTHLLFVDSDVGYRAPDVTSLLSRELDAVGGAYVKRWAEQTVPAVALPGPRGVETASGLVECSIVPAGFLLLSRHTLQTMYDRYADEGMWSTGRENRKFVSEDTMFCRRWRALENYYDANNLGRLYLDGSVRLGHVGEIVYRLPPVSTPAPEN